MSNVSPHARESMQCAVRTVAGGTAVGAGCPRYAGQRTAGASPPVTASPSEVWCLAASLQRGRVFPLIPVQARASLLMLQLRFVSAHACKLHHVLDLLLFPPSKHRCCCPQGREVARSAHWWRRGERLHPGESVPAVHRPNLKREFKVKYCSAPSSTNGEHLFCTSRASRFLRHERANPSIKRTVKGLRPSPAAYVKR